MAVRPALRLNPVDAAIALNGGPLAVNIAQMRRAGPNRPKIVDLVRTGRLRYSAYDPREHWQTYDELLEQLNRYGYAIGDCEDLSLALAAELQLGDGPFRDPHAKTSVYRTGPQMSHVVVDSPLHGRIDISRLAGMGGVGAVSDEVAARMAVELDNPNNPDYFVRGR